MPRASKSRVQVEIQLDESSWTLYKGGFSRVPDAERWVSENILDGFRMRVVRVAGIFEKQVKVIKR